MQVRQDQNQDQDGINNKSTMRSELGQIQDEIRGGIGMEPGLESFLDRNRDWKKLTPRIYRFKSVT